MTVTLLPVRITTKGQVTIPQKLRAQYGLDPDTEVTFEAMDRGVLIRPARSRDEDLKRRLARATGSATTRMSTDEILQLTRGEE